MLSAVIVNNIFSFWLGHKKKCFVSDYPSDPSATLNICWHFVFRKVETASLIIVAAGEAGTFELYWSSCRVRRVVFGRVTATL